MAADTDYKRMWWIWSGISGLILLIVLSIGSVRVDHGGTPPNDGAIEDFSGSKDAVFPVLTPLFIKGEKIFVEIADSEAERARGLSLRESLSPDRGMLFVLPSPEHAGFWMKDMKFPIDIIWISADKKISHIETAVSPETFPNVFYPERKSLYALEVAAGFSEKHDLRVGDPISF